MKDGPVAPRYTVTHKDGVPLGPDAPPLFILSPETDPHSRAALAIYARICRTTHPILANEIPATYGVPHLGMVFDDEIDRIVAAMNTNPCKEIPLPSCPAIVPGLVFRSTGPSGNVWRVESITENGKTAKLVNVECPNGDCDPALMQSVVSIMAVFYNGRAEEVPTD